MSKPSRVALAIGWFLIATGVLVVLTIGPCTYAGIKMMISPPAGPTGSPDSGWSGIGELMLVVTLLPTLAGLGAILLGGMLLWRQRGAGTGDRAERAPRSRMRRVLGWLLLIAGVVAAAPSALFAGLGVGAFLFTWLAGEPGNDIDAALIPALVDHSFWLGLGGAAILLAGKVGGDPAPRRPLAWSGFVLSLLILAACARAATWALPAPSSGVMPALGVAGRAALGGLVLLASAVFELLRGKERGGAG